MRHVTILSFAVLILAGCASPGYLGVKPIRAEADGSTFLVYHKFGTVEVEAYRVSVEMLPSKRRVFRAAKKAIETATKCRVIDGSIYGDQAIITAEVDCFSDQLVPAGTQAME
ncbi:MAG: hypothetical protein ACSHXD_00765 [Marinosulfonomonas sp.]